MSPFSIAEISIYQSKIRLKEPFVISLGRLEFAENIIVQIKTKNSIIGYGECSPFMTIHGESMETCFVVGRYLAGILIGNDALQIAHCISLMDAVIYGNASIKSAFDIALYDIASQHAGLPLYAFLGGAHIKKIQTDYTVSIGTPEKMAADAKSIVEQGFEVIKVKLGGTMETDTNRIQKIREMVGMKMPLRIDANQGWDAKTALEILKSLEKYNIQFCEEPIPRWDFMLLPELKKKSPIPIMADETCCSPHDAERLINIDACSYLNIKLGKSGGIFNARKIIALADKHHIKMQMGGFLESRLGFTASAHVAMTSNNIIFYDFDTPLMFIDDPVSEGIQYGTAGMIDLPGGPGLGATFPMTYLKTLPSWSVS